jgi:hypothetical protein
MPDETEPAMLVFRRRFIGQISITLFYPAQFWAGQCTTAITSYLPYSSVLFSLGTVNEILLHAETKLNKT